MKTITQEMYEPASSPQDQQPTRRHLRRRLILLGIGVLLFISVLAIGIPLLVLSIGNQSPEMATVKQYYTAIQQQQYTQAYSYLDTRLTPVSLEGYSQVATTLDATQGKVVDYSITAFSLASTQGTTFTVHVTRMHQSYDVHLKLIQVGTTWKVMSYDGI